ncbi:hypothetical protein EAE96_008426 [Botrytis aclada]|nr:hypothetical protein EAE96_008426 [Botrytis aclada]
MMDQITQTSRTEADIMAENKSTAHNDAVTQEQRRSISPALLPIPREIIRMIAALLPKNNAAYFTLRSRSMKEAIGDRYIKAMKNSIIQRNGVVPKAEVEFVALLAKDLPEHFACFKCARIHRAKTIKWPNNIKDNLSCMKYWAQDWAQNAYCLKIKFMSYYEIYFPQI